MSAKKYLPNVTFKYDEDEKKCKGACFAGLNVTGKKQVTYYATICPVLNKEEVENWINFISTLLPVITAKIDEKTVDFYVDCVKLTRFQALLALSFCRYIQEFPEIVKLFNANKSNPPDLEKDFQIFQQSSKGMLCRYYDNIYGHGVFNLDYNSPITLTTFKKNLKKQIGSVVGHFHA